MYTIAQVKKGGEEDVYREIQGWFTFLFTLTYVCICHRYRNGHTGFNIDKKQVDSRQEISKSVGGFLEDWSIGGQSE